MPPVTKPSPSTPGVAPSATAWFRLSLHPWFRPSGSAPPGSVPLVSAPLVPALGSAPWFRPSVPPPKTRSNDRYARLKLVRTQKVPHQSLQSHESQLCVQNGSWSLILEAARDRGAGSGTICRNSGPEKSRFGRRFLQNSHDATRGTMEQAQPSARGARDGGVARGI